MSLERLKVIHDQLDGSMSILSVIMRGEIKRSPSGTLLGDGIWARTVYSESTIQFLISEYKQGATYPKHSHDGSVEYLICTSGCFSVKMFLTEGELDIHLVAAGSVKIPVGVVHEVTSIAGGRLAAVLIPPERAYLDGRLSD